jgi:segregation and condensation protein A
MVKQLSLDGRYIVSLDIFEGPLDLLLHLIRKHELDIFDIPIAFITTHYLEYLDSMKQMNLDLASEYLEMAATLTLIKSRMLVPSEESPDDDLFEDGPDPREELVRRLLEYQKYKTAAEELTSLPLLGRDTFPRGSAEDVSVERDLASPGLFALMEAFQKVLKGADLDPIHEISITRMSVSARINQLVDVLRQKRKLTFLELFDGQSTKSRMVVTFLSCLEMTKLGLIQVYQAGIHSEIHITAAAAIEEADHILTERFTEE